MGDASAAPHSSLQLSVLFKWCRDKDATMAMGVDGWKRGRECAGPPWAALVAKEPELPTCSSERTWSCQGDQQSSRSPCMEQNNHGNREPALTPKKQRTPKTETEAHPQ